MIIKKIIRRKALNDRKLEGLHPVIERILLARGIKTLEEIDNNINNLLPFSNMLNIEKAAKLLSEGIINQKKILIIGDYDADGATSTALCVKALTHFGSKNVSYLIPNRVIDGYGLTENIVRQALKQNPDIIVTVDNGITSHEGVKLAIESGIEVLITDHHLAGSRIPEATVIVNPNQPGDNFPSKNLAGVGVIFYVIIATRAHLRSIDWFKSNNTKEPNLAQYLDLVALGTVADIVPLDSNNRTLVKLGLDIINSNKASIGVNALCEIVKLNPKVIRSSNLSFALAPRVNAAGRIDDMTIGIECLLSNDYDKAIYYANKLNNINNERKDIEETMKEQAMLALQNLDLDEKNIPYGICLYDPTWHEGVVGILASRVKEKYNRPTVIFTKSNNGALKGSARSIQGINIKDILESVASTNNNLIEKFGGHAMAAGLTLKNSAFDEFNKLFCENIKLNSTPNMFNHEIHTDGELTADEFDLNFAKLLKKYGPWGQSFPEPTFDGNFEVLNSYIVKEKHIKLSLKVEDKVIDAIMFNAPEESMNVTDQTIHAVYKLEINNYFDLDKVQLIVDQISVVK